MSWIEINGISLHYNLSGKGPILVLVHELGGSLRSWDGVVSRLGDHFTVLRYDQRGCGQSEKVTAPFRYEDLATDLRDLLDALDIKAQVGVVGAAVGAAQALVHAVHPRGRIAGLAMLNPALEMDATRLGYMHQRGAQAVAGGMRAVLPLSLDRSWPSALRKDWNTYEAYRARFIANDPQCFALHHQALADVGSLLAAVQCPTMMAAGVHDTVRPWRTIRELADGAGARFEIVDSGHLMHVQAPLETARLLGAFFEKIFQTQDKREEIQ